MRIATRLGVVTATAALGASVVLTGAGVASAALIANSPNSVSVNGSTATVSNKTDSTLSCDGTLTTSRLADLLYKTATNPGYTPSTAEALAMYNALQAGNLAYVSGEVEAGKSQALATQGVGVTVNSGLTAVVVCSDGAGKDYLLRSGGAGGALGSLDMGGSLGDLTGSLGL